MTAESPKTRQESIPEQVVVSSPGASPSLNGMSSNAELLALYRQMYLIRRFEEACAENYTTGNIRGFLHLYIGQEAVAVGALSALLPGDYIVTHYRDHGHALARGLDTNRIMAELFGRKTGLSKGKGGSMHLFDAAKRFMGGHAIVGAQLPLAAGLGLSCLYKETSDLALVFFGDGAVNQGTFHETMNLAAVWHLPLLFFLENNLYGMGSAVENVRSAGNDFHTISMDYGIDSVVVDGMDVLAVKQATQESAVRIRNGEGPKFIEAKTFRYVGHSMADPARYRSEEELAYWLGRDPLKTFPRLLIEHGVAGENDLEAARASVEEEVAASVRFAEQSAEPSPEDLFEDTYA